MTTTPTYNREGVTVDALAATGLTQETAAPIVRSCGETVVLVSCSSNNACVLLPSDADIGDLVEVHNTDSAITVGVLCVTGQNVSGLDSDQSTAISPFLMRQFRKISSTVWGAGK